MPPSRTARRTVTERACVECQRRKTKCHGGGELTGQPCDYCSKFGKQCIFEQPEQRTPLTRQNLDLAEERCRRLEALLRQHEHHRAPTSTSRAEADHGDAEHSLATVTVGHYEWDEAHESPDQQIDERDGMAAFPQATKSAGYLGPSSAHDMLKALPISTAPTATPGIPPHNRSVDVPVSSFMQGRRLLFSSIQEALITAYFACYNAYYPILDETAFRAQCARRGQISPKSSWHITYFAVLAIGEWVSGGGVDEHSPYYECARNRLTPEVFEAGSLNSVQAFLLLGNLMQKIDRPNTGYNFVGMAMRMAIGLGLHRELPPTATVTPLERQRRRTLFWLVYCFDCWFNITTGRPALAPDQSFDVHIPSDDDHRSQSELPEDVVDLAGPTSSSTTAALARLTKIAISIYTEFISAPTCADVNGRLSVMEHMLRNWRKALPAYFSSDNVPSWFKAARAIVFWKESNLLTLLLLSSQKHHKDDYERMAVGARCQSAAANALLDIANFCEANADDMHPGLVWYAAYFTLQAMLCFAAQAIYRRRSGPDQHSDIKAYADTAAIAVGCLQGLRHKSVAAVRALSVVVRLRDAMRGAGGQEVARTDGVVGPMPKPQLHGPHENGAMSSEPTAFVSPDAVANMSQQTIPDMVMLEWETAADPSLQAIFDGMSGYFAEPMFFDAMNGY